MSKSNFNILGIIPARGGSKRLPDKSTRSLSGKPLIAWTIEQANSSRQLTKAIVSTDDARIASISRDFGGIVPFIRPVHLAQDDTPSIDVIFHATDFFSEVGEVYDIVVLLEPTSPLREGNDIDRAIELFLENIDTADSLVSVGEIHLENPLWAKKIQNGYVTSYIASSISPARSQELEKVYFPYGVIYISKLSSLRKYRSFYQPRTLPYYIKRWQNYEVDDLYDFYCIEAVMKLRGLEK